MFDDLKNKKPVKLFTDQFRTPISLKDTSRIISELAEMDIKGETINLGAWKEFPDMTSERSCALLLVTIKIFFKKVQRTKFPIIPKLKMFL